MTRLKELRLKTGKSIKQVAEEIGISANYISEMENEKKDISKKCIPILCKYYNVKPNELLGYEDFILIDETTNEFTESDIKMMRMIKQLTESDHNELYTFIEYLIFKHQRKIEAMENGKKGN